MHVGGVVSARSVKLLDRIHNPGMFLKSLFPAFHLLKLGLLTLIFILKKTKSIRKEK